MVTETLRWRGGWARIAPLLDVAHLTVGAGAPPPEAVVERCLARLHRAGYREVVTNALAPADALPFVDAGFTVRERLHLLDHDLTNLPPLTNGTQRARRKHRATVLRIDSRAFDAGWRLAGRGALTDALRATPVSRFRIISNGRVVAYAISGRAGTQGFLQRVAVDPDARGQGYGRALVVDALHWLRRHHVRRAVVNTQLTNDAALALYESCGFRRLPLGLCVLGRPLGTPS